MNPELVLDLLSQIHNAHAVESRPDWRHTRNKALRHLLDHLVQERVRPQHWRAHPKLCQVACHVLVPILGYTVAAEVADILATMGSTARLSVPALVEAATAAATVTDRDLSRVVRALGRVGMRDDEAIGAVIGILEQYCDAEEERSDTVFPGIEAAQALGRLRSSNPDAVDALREVCGRSSVHPRVLLESGTALWRLGGPEGDATLTPERRVAVDAISCCLAAVFPRNSTEGRRRSEQPHQAAGLAQLDVLLHGTADAPSPPTPPAPFPGPAVRVLAARRLCHLGQEAITATANRLAIAALADESEVRNAAQKALKAGGYADLKARMRIVIESLTADQSLLGPFACLGHRLSRCETKVISTVLQAYITPLASLGRSGRTRGQAPHRVLDHAASVIRSGGGPLVGQLLTLLTSLPDAEREAIAHLLKHLTTSRPPFLLTVCPNTIPCLHQHLASPNSWIRLDTAVALWHSSPDQPDRGAALASLIGLVQSRAEPEPLRSDVAWSLGALVPAAAAAIPALDAIAGDNSEPHPLRNGARSSRDKIASA